MSLYPSLHPVSYCRARRETGKHCWVDQETQEGLYLLDSTWSWIFGLGLPCNHQMSSSIRFLQLLLGVARGFTDHLGDKVLAVYPGSTQSCLAGAVANRGICRAALQGAETPADSLDAEKAVDWGNLQFAELLTLLCKVSSLSRKPHFSAYVGYLNFSFTP